LINSKHPSPPLKRVSEGQKPDERCTTAEECDARQMSNALQPVTKKIGSF